VAKTTKPKISKGEAKKITAAKKAAGKKAKSASAKKNAMAMKKAGKGIFAPKKLSDAMAAICGAKTLPRTEVTKKIWVYIKANKLNDGRTIKPDAKLKAIFPVASIDMLKMAGYVSKHLS
jgi:chromatin remodeling complex protein RSC6